MTTTGYLFANVEDCAMSILIDLIEEIQVKQYKLYTINSVVEQMIGRTDWRKPEQTVAEINFA